MTRPTIGIIGAGAMGEVFARGLLRAGWEKKELILADRRADRVSDLEHSIGVVATLSVIDAVMNRDVLIISVKPKDILTVLEEISDHVTDDQVVISIAAGVMISVFENALLDVPVVRAMPNTPAAVDLGMTAYTVGGSVEEDHIQTVESVLTAVGLTLRVPEDLLDSVTAVSGTGPAYLFLLAETLVEAAIREGLSHHGAEKLVSQTLRGASELVATSEKSAFRLRGEVTSPGGTTAAAMHVLEDGGFRALMENAVRAAAERSRELGRKVMES